MPAYDGGDADLCVFFFQYRNECIMKLDACRRRRDLHVVYNGECSMGEEGRVKFDSVDGGNSIPFSPLPLLFFFCQMVEGHESSKYTKAQSTRKYNLQRSIENSRSEGFVLGVAPVRQPGKKLMTKRNSQNKLLGAGVFD